ncbi:hypothetical protein FACS1894163_07550 [Spirochaetia bacterium]|nr:hypothetical protein FACS1894163_07550 [Spirochaetia bacterium]
MNLLYKDEVYKINEFPGLDIKRVTFALAGSVEVPQVNRLIADSLM